MLFLFFIEFGFCSPNKFDYYTSKFPQFNVNYMWWQKKGSFFRDNQASPQTKFVSLAQNNYKILVVATNAEFINSYIQSINSVLKDYVQIQELVISEQSTIDEFFEALDVVNTHQFDLVMLNFVNCASLIKYNQEYALDDQTNKFYRYSTWRDIPTERIQSLEQIQQILFGYQKFNNQKLTDKNDYFSFKNQQISGHVPLFLTSIIDTTSSLLFNSVTFCHISPTGQIQSSSKNCQIAIPIGMQTYGINGNGHIGNGFQFLLKLLSQISSEHDDLIYLYAIIHECAQMKRSNLQQLYGSPFGLTNFIQIQYIKSLYKVPKYITKKDIILRQNVRSGDTLFLGQFRVFQIQFTIRGREDVFEARYENNFKTSLKNNQEDMKDFEGIYIFICQKVNSKYIPKLIGQVQQRSGYHNFVIQSSAYSNSQFSNEILIWYSYSQNIDKIQEEIKYSQMINTTMVTSLQIIGSIVPMSLQTISDIGNTTAGVKLYFISNSSFIYLVCLRLNKIDILQVDFQKDGELIILQLDPGLECNLYFCQFQHDYLSTLNQNCAKTEEFNVIKQQDDYILITLCTVGLVWLLLYQTFMQITYKNLK